MSSRRDDGNARSAVKRILRRVLPALNSKVRVGTRQFGQTSEAGSTASVAPSSVTQTRWQEHPKANELIQSGAFCQAFYQSATGKTFAGAVEAAAHYLSYGIRKLLPPNPFVDALALPGDVRKSMREGKAERLVEYVSSRDSSDFGLAFNPAFVDSVLGSELDGSDTGRRGLSPLGRFVQGVDEQTKLPVPDGSLLFNVRARDFAKVATATAKSLLAEQDLRVPRPTHTWNEVKEADWKSSIAAIELDEAPLVSIVMPVKNRQDRVRDAIDSIRAQSYTNWELLVVDDHSTDGTLDVLREFAVLDERISVLQNGGSGVSAARNHALRAISGHFVAFLDSDNTWTADYLECVLKAMKQGNSEWAYAASRLIRGQEITYMAFEGGYRHLQYRNHIDMNVIVVSTNLLARSGEFDESLMRWVDHDLVLRLIQLADPLFVPMIGCNYDHGMDREDRITVKEPNYWQWVVLGKSILDWEAEDTKQRKAGRVSIVLTAKDEGPRAVRAVKSLLNHSGLDDIEVIVVDNGSHSPHALSMAQNLSFSDKIRVVRSFRSMNRSLANNVGLLSTTGEYVLFLNTGLVPREGSLQDLVPVLEDQTVAGVQPLLLNVDDTIFSAGTIWATTNSLPLDFLEHHPQEDAQHVAGYTFAGAQSAALLVRAEDAVAVRGFDPRYVDGMEGLDLCMRLRNVRDGGFRVVPTISMTFSDARAALVDKNPTGNRQLFMDHWRDALPSPNLDLVRKAGFSIGSTGQDDTRAMVSGTTLKLVRSVTAPRRWAIKSPANGGVPGDRWGDTHFINSIAVSLRGLKQDVVTYRNPAHGSVATALDDVSLVLRGRNPSRPIPGKINIIWIISHPNLVTREELSGFDIVYAASTSWARWATEEFGIDVRPLLQATDSTLFHYRKLDRKPSAEVVFVGGNFRNRKRVAVHNAVAAGVNLRVYGPDWDGEIPNESIAGDYVSNGGLVEVYRDAYFVLADHWKSMADEGFIQNRIFDAVAAGCRVITDEVKDLREIFGEEVVVAKDAKDIRRYVDEATSAEADQNEELRRGAAANVMANHSFDARARQLLDDVEDWLSKNVR